MQTLQVYFQKRYLCLLYTACMCALILQHFLLAGQSVVAPMETGFSSLHEVFALWASPSVTYEPLNVTAFTRSSLAQAMSLALDDEVLFMFWFSCGTEGSLLFYIQSLNIGHKYCTCATIEILSFASLQETADVVFVVDDRRIRAHRAVLKIRCQYFRNMFQEHWKENNLE